MSTHPPVPHTPPVAQQPVDSGPVCQHCSQRGGVSMRVEKRKVGISPGKIVLAIFTGGLSLFVTGLARKATFAVYDCVSCNGRWAVAR